MDKLLQIFISFLQIGFISIGGGYATIPIIQQQIVTEQGWITFQEFTDIITISQMTPGPLAVNAATFVGIRTGGLPGAVLATTGCVLSGVMISILLFLFFKKHHQSDRVNYVLDGLRSSSTGLIASASSTLVILALFQSSSLPKGFEGFDIQVLVIMGISLLVLRKWKISIMIIMIVTGVIGYFIY